MGVADMFDQLIEIEKKFEELSHELSKPEIASNPNKYKKIARERAGLEKTVNTWREYKEIKQDYDNNKDLAHNKDKDLADLAKEELPELETKLGKLEAKLKELLIPKDLDDDRDLILEIRAGTGGDEAALFAGDLFRMYQRFAEIQKWGFEILESNPTGLGGFKEVTIEVTGLGAYGALKFESGVHRVQRVPKTESSGRVHTSACTVASLPVAEEVDLDINPADLRIDTYRASGAGGQHVNTTDSAVRVTHIPTGTVVACQDGRSQHANKATAMRILRSRILEAEKEKHAKEVSDARRQMVKSGDRSEKIRTYNFPQNRLTDHRIGLTLYNLDQILDGKLIEVVQQLQINANKMFLENINK